jgi:hypothetical protein
LAVDRALLMASTCAGRADADDLADWLRSAFVDVRAHMAAVAADEEQDVGDYATTLGVAILTGRAVGVAQIGDTIAVVGCAGKYRAVEPAPHSEYVNETAFITDEGALGQLRVTVMPSAEVDTVVFSTDGLRFKILADLATGAPFAPFFEDLTAYARSPAASDNGVCQFLDELEDQSGDDKSLIAAVRVETDSASRANDPKESAKPIINRPVQEMSRSADRESPGQGAA